MSGNKLMLSHMLLLAFLMFGVQPLAQARDLSTLQTALRIAQDEMKAAEAERDADVQHVAATEKEIEQLKKQLKAGREKATRSEKRYVESKKQHDKAQAALDQAWKQR
ncbi:MAG: hypothetical protein K2P67_03285 [Gallionellaceae bacterium]|jgi:septal ring factor EnvC (AmiA/AmiB activator)|nr:hypothetical protein [Gallionellaceae bacterium]